MNKSEKTVIEDEIRIKMLNGEISDLKKRISKCEEVTKSNEFKEYRNFIAKANGILKGNKIQEIDDYEFPKLKGVSERQEYAAKKYREKFVIANEKRFQKLVKILAYKDRFNWKLLHENQVTPQEYVILFSSDVGDIFARGIVGCFDDNYEYIPNSCDKYEG